ncbi:glycosyltransferase family 2 protein [Muricauda brasiliensis]|uniref:glycosyltransferase family 2 protein n=1 Tax=Muricauda brasiliensis TaxID=2162892 RepID=UPI000D3D535C|nr:glycosyltransferase family 2 protein [Muricauda brasiliensis]
MREDCKYHLVSIVTPVYNSEKYLAQNIKSVQLQTHTSLEHILVDDCSTDNSAQIIKHFAEKDNRIRYVKLSENSGAGVARNKAIELAKGDYIAFLDSDDLWYPDKLKKQLAFMQANNYPFTFTAYDKIDIAGKLLGKQVNAKRKVTYKSALYKNPIGCLTVIYSISFFGKQYMPKIRKRQDYALWLKLLKKTDAYGIQQCLSSYRVGNESISSNKFKLLTYEWRIYRDIEGLSRMKSVFYLISAILIKLKSYF